MTAIIYHNPRCSKSRQALQLLREHGIEPEIIEYLKTPPTVEQLNRILDLLHMEPRELMRRKERIYREASLGESSISHDALIQAMIQHPILIERPIVIANGKAALGRPPEKVLEVL